MPRSKLTLDRALEIIPKICQQDTAQSDLWTPERPVTGHCALASVLIKSNFGGKIVRAEMNNGVIHYWNQLSTGAWVDATRAQFDDWVVPCEIDVDTPEHLYWFEDTEDKYVKFRRRFQIEWTQMIVGSNTTLKTN